jgi:ketosteroid isomerase-like protein
MRAKVSVALTSCAREAPRIKKAFARYVLVFLCLELIFARSARPQTNTFVSEQAVRQAERELTDAERTRNAEKVSQILADGYIALDDNGTRITKSQLIDFLESGAMKTNSVELGPMDVAVFGDVAVVQGSDTEKTSTKVQDTNGKSVWVDTSDKYVWTDVWAKQVNGKWQEVRTQVHRHTRNASTSDQGDERTEGQSGESKSIATDVVQPSDSDKKTAIPKAVVEQQFPSNVPEGLFPSDGQLVAAARTGFQGNRLKSAQVYGQEPETTYNNASNCLKFAMVFVGSPLVAASGIGEDAHSHFMDFPDQGSISKLRGIISLDLIFQLEIAFDFSWEVALTQGSIFVRPFGVPTYESHALTCFDGDTITIHFAHYKFNLTEIASRLDWNKPISLVVRTSFGAESTYQLNIQKALGQAHR